MYRLVAVDLDGTLLNSHSWVSEGNREAIAYAIKKGVKVVICSGRIFTGARVFARQISAEGPIITCNGAVIKDIKTEEVLYDEPLSSEDCCRVIDICHRENIYFHAYIEDTMYTEVLEYGASFYWKLNDELPEQDRIDIRLVKDVADVIKSGFKPASKFVIVSEEPEHLLKVRKQVCEIESVEVMSSNINNFEVVKRGVNKGNALKILSEKLNIPREEIIAVGDNENDCSMIRFAGLGVAMGNAEKSIKDVADYITLNNDEDGVSEVLKKFVL